MKPIERKEREGESLQAPFPYFFGGKAKIAPLVWERFGADVPNAVEPFAGSAAILLGRPGGAGKIETINDADCYVANFFRAIQHDPERTAYHASYPVFENDLHARHAWLVTTGRERVAMLEGDPEWFDPKAAGWWAWGMSCWIGSGFCSGQGPWHVVDGKLVRGENDGKGTWRQCPHLSSAGVGVNRKRPHLGGAFGTGQKGILKDGVNLYSWFAALANRLCRVRVCCGDWKRVTGPSVTFAHGMTAVFLDPPYSAEAGRDNNIYRVESTDVAHEAREWAIENEDNPLLRIALCGYEGEGHDELVERGWEVVEWKASGGYGSQGEGQGRENAKRERIWFSPQCLRPRKARNLFEVSR